jgi:transposase, IS5 family
MREIIDPQLQLGEVDISKIEFDPRSRDDIPKILKGLQYVYCTPELREKVFKILEEIVPPGTDANNGRPGMELWKIFVLGTIRLNCDWDYDRLKEMADHHIGLREMLGHNLFNKKDKYALQTLKDNVSLLTLEVLDKINVVVVEAGHSLVKKKPGEGLKGRCDSSVVKTDVHFPTDISLLFDAIRKVIILTSRLSLKFGGLGWRQSKHNVKKIKNLMRRIQRMKRSTSKNPEKKREREDLILQCYQEYLEVVRKYFLRAKGTIREVQEQSSAYYFDIMEIERYLVLAEKLMDQVDRRVILDEVIKHEEKIFSVFEEHTEWISKGKAGVPVELGLRVCVMEDQYQFILHHRVMQKETDDKIAIAMVEEAKRRFSDFRSCSFDKGFWSPLNQETLQKILERVVLPKKGRLSVEDRERQEDEYFIQARKQHSAVESAINALDHHGLDRCPDHGIYGFERYVALGIVGRNLHRLGGIILEKELKTLKQRNKLKQRKKMRLAA